MANVKLAQGVKELRKGKGFSQEELAKKSGLSLRTIQRVENGETEPTGETLKRISAILDVTPNELIDWDSKKEILKKTVKTKYEYLHIFVNKLVISKAPEIKDLVEDYSNSVNNVFKTLMVFFIGIPIFTTLAVIFYNLGKTDLALYVGSFALLFLVVAFNTILFTSGSSLIRIENISKIRIKRKLYHNVVVIFHRESGRLKERYLILKKNQFDTMKNCLLSEKLIEEKDINLKDYNGWIIIFITALVIIVTLYSNYRYNNITMYYYGALILFLVAVLLIKMILKLRNPLNDNTTNR